MWCDEESKYAGIRYVFALIDSPKAGEPDFKTQSYQSSDRETDKLEWVPCDIAIKTILSNRRSAFAATALDALTTQDSDGNYAVRRNDHFSIPSHSRQGSAVSARQTGQSPSSGERETAKA